jgi:hypothetical protein
LVDWVLITHPEKGRFGAKTTKVGLAGIGKQEAQFKGVVGQYWQRHQIMRKSLNDWGGGRSPVKITLKNAAYMYDDTCRFLACPNSAEIG